MQQPEKPNEIPHYESPPKVTYGFAMPVDYGDGRHPGFDYGIALWTPIIASAPGVITWHDTFCFNPPVCEGEFVYVESSEVQAQLYGHLLKTAVKKGDRVVRGQLIGFSGKSSDGNAHLHFGVCIVGEETNCQYRRDSINPDEYWIGGKARCFDEKEDYSVYGNNEMTHPVACGEYGAKLKVELEG